MVGMCESGASLHKSNKRLGARMRAHTVLAGRSAPLLRRAVPLSQEEARRANDAKKEGHDLEAKGSAARNVYAI